MLKYVTRSIMAGSFLMCSTAYALLPGSCNEVGLPETIGTSWCKVDEKSGGKYTEIENDVHTFDVTDEESQEEGRSRAEIRYRSVKGDSLRKLAGKFQVIEFTGDKISIIQALNVDKKNGEFKPSGESSPAAQLGIKMDDNDKMVFYVVQGDSEDRECSNAVRPSFEAQVLIVMSFKRASTPKFEIFPLKNGEKISQNGNGQAPWKSIVCQKGNTLDNDKDSYFYGKLGAYVTKSGQGDAKVQWRLVSTY